MLPVYNGLRKRFCRLPLEAGDVETTKKWFDELRASCFTPDVDHYNMSRGQNTEKQT